MGPNEKIGQLELQSFLKCLIHTIVLCTVATTAVLALLSFDCYLRANEGSLELN